METPPIFNGKLSTISMVIFNSYVKLPEGNTPLTGNEVNHPPESLVTGVYCLVKITVEGV
jgi:hypothetical protein